MLSNIVEAYGSKWTEGPYKNIAELVHVDWLSQLPGNGLRGDMNIGYNPDNDDWDYGDLKQGGESMLNGIQEPLIIVVGKSDHRVYLAEGNHRLAAAKLVNIDWLPVRVIIYKEAAKGKEFGDELLIPYEGYVSSDLPPSKVFKNVPIKSTVSESTELREGLSSILYHFTYFESLKSILGANEFRLTPSIGTDPEIAAIAKPKNIYYMSTTRSKLGSYHYPATEGNNRKQGALLVLDGDKLQASGYSGRPTNYWVGNPKTPEQDEAEDRIFSTKSAIDDAARYIKELHVLFNFSIHTQPKLYDEELRKLISILRLAKQRKIPYWVYDNGRKFVFMDKNSAIKTIPTPTQKVKSYPLPDVKDKEDVRTSDNYRGSSRNNFEEYLELLNIATYDKLSSGTKRSVQSMLQVTTDEETGKLKFHGDSGQQFKAAIHNAKDPRDLQRKNLDKFLAAMQKRKLNSAYDFFMYVYNKFGGEFGLGENVVYENFNQISSTSSSIIDVQRRASSIRAIFNGDVLADSVYDTALESASKKKTTKKRNPIARALHAKRSQVVPDKKAKQDKQAARKNVDLDEAFDQPLRYKWTHRSRDIWQGEFEPGFRDKVKVVFDFDSYEKTWAFYFKRNDSVVVTDEGNEFKVFSTVIAMATEFAQIKNPEYIVFDGGKPQEDSSGDRSSREKLYDRLVNTIGKKLGYVLSDADRSADGTQYFLTRADLMTENIDESLNQPYTYAWKSKEEDEWQGYFYTDDSDPIEFLAFEDSNPMDENALHFWEISFTRNNRHTKSGQGDQFRIFATIVKMIQEFVNTVEPTVIRFSADKHKDSNSRAKLYQRMVRSLSANTGYKVEEVNTREHLIFVLTDQNAIPEQLGESFNNPYPYTWKQNTPSPHLTGIFKTADRSQVTLSLALDSVGVWSIVFHREGSTEVTNEGDQFRIFATIIAMLREFVKIKNPSFVEFGAEKEEADGYNISRVQLYKRLVKTFASEMGFEISDINEHPTGATYHLHAKNMNEDNTVGSILYKDLAVTESNNPDVEIKKTRDDIYYAYLNGQRVGQAQVYDYRDEKVGENERYIWKSSVKPGVTRQGVATMMYNEIAADLKKDGLTLVPSPDQQLSADAFAFWKARDPESVKNHGTYKAEPFQKYVGQEVTVKDRPGVITRIGWSVPNDAALVTVRYTDVPEGSSNSVTSKLLSVVQDQLSEGEEDTLELPDINVDDVMMVGKFKNRKATVKGFKKDDHGQPILKTNKGDQQLFKPRVTKLEPKKIDESFDQPYEYSLSQVGKFAYRGRFLTVDEHVVEVGIRLEYPTEDIWEVRFSRNNDLSKTNEGDQFKIFASVITIIKEFVDKEHPYGIVFKAEKNVQRAGTPDSRINLYARLVKKFANQSGYSVDHSNQGSWDLSNGHEVEFKLYRNDIQNE